VIVYGCRFIGELCENDACTPEYGELFGNSAPLAGIKVLMNLLIKKKRF
jgi:hypothetical protein